MANLDFSKYLDVAVEELERPKPLPIGHYFATIQSWKGAEIEFEKGVKTPVVVVIFKVDSADEDVDLDLLPEGGGKGKLLDKNYRLNDPDKSGQFQLRVLGEETCDIPVKGLHLTDLLDAMKGQDVKLYVDHRQGQEEGQVFPTVKRILSVHG